jgi:hypothetical protein
LLCALVADQDPQLHWDETLAQRLSQPDQIADPLFLCCLFVGITVTRWADGFGCGQEERRDFCFGGTGFLLWVFWRVRGALLGSEEVGEVFLALFDGGVFGEWVKGADLIGNVLKMCNDFDIDFFEKVITEKGEQLRIEPLVELIEEEVTDKTRRMGN